MTTPNKSLPPENIVETKDKPKMIFPYFESKKIWIKRKTEISAFFEANIAHAPDSKSKIGAAFRNQDTLRGLTHKEEIRFLPLVINVVHTDPLWHKVTRDYWCNISKEIPLEGLELEIGIRYDSQEEYDHDLKAEKDHNGTPIEIKGTPINLSDYILWRYCLVYSRVANNEADVHKTANIWFFLYSKEKEITMKKASFEAVKTANMTMYQNLANRDWVDSVLSLLIARDNDPAKKVGIGQLASLGDDEKDILLQDYVNKNAILFSSLANDKNLQTKSFIENCVAAGKLTRIANTQAISFETQTIGNNMEETVSFLTNPKNVEVLNTLKAQMKLTS